MEEKQYSILYVDDEKNNLHAFKASFKWNYRVFTALSAFEGLEILEKEDIHVIIADQRMPYLSGTEFFKRVLKRFPDPLRIILTGYSDLEVIIRAINECGIYQYLTKPWKEATLTQVLKNATEVVQLRRENQSLLRQLEAANEKLKAENSYLKEEISQGQNYHNMITNNNSLKELLTMAEKVAITSTTVLIRGETGTGKELMARAIHAMSKRAERPLIKVNSAVLPENLIESELFGHEKGAFTGAVQRRVGRFELADKGTLFLDEIGELPLDLQAKILRVLQEGEFERLGGNKTIKVDVRIIAATNRNLEQAVRDKTFREDLYFRLNVFPIYSPPLRERIEDIPLLVRHFLKKYEANIGRSITEIPAAVMERLCKHSWPGNIRELENVIERSMIISSGKTLELGNWRPEELNVIPKGEQGFPTLQEMEIRHITQALEASKWQVFGEKGAAKVLGMNPKTLFSRMTKLGIKRPDE